MSRFVYLISGVLAVLVLYVFSGVLVPVHAYTYVEAKTRCESWAASELARWGESYSRYDCVFVHGGGHPSWYYGWDAIRRFDGSPGISFQVDDYVPGNPCNGMSPQHIYAEGKVLQGSSTCVRGPVQDDGSQAMCGANLSPVSPPTLNPYSGRWETYMSFSPTGQVCSIGDGDGPGEISPPAGGAPPNAPPLPDPLPPDNPNPPKLCNGGSCYDPLTNTSCAIVGGSQLCTQGGVPGGGGGCTSNGSGTICSGSPTAPLPPAPPASPISDPPTEINSSDTTTHANPVTGGNYTTVTNVYGSGGGQTSSGAGPGDSQPPGSPPGDGDDPDKGSASGGQDCNTPPICSGNAPTCAVVGQVWLLRCGAPKDDESDKNGNGQPDWTEVQPGDGDQYETPTPEVGDVFHTETVGIEGIDDSGWAGNTCPTLPVVNVFGKPWSMDQVYFCEWLAMLRPIFLLVAGFVAVRIMVSGGKS